MREDGSLKSKGGASGPHQIISVLVQRAYFAGTLAWFCGNHNAL